MFKTQLVYPSLAIANEFIRRGLADRRPVDPLKLQKILYFAQGWHLAIMDRPLFDEQIEAWPYGPVVSSIYHRFKRYGSTEIKEPGAETGPDGRLLAPCISETDVATQDFLTRIWQQHRDFSGLQLSSASHAQGSPWDETKNECLKKWGYVPRGQDIPPERIRDYFLNLARQIK